MDDDEEEEYYIIDADEPEPEPEDLGLTPEEKAAEDARYEAELKARIDRGETFNAVMVDQKPQFPGGETEMYKWIRSTIVYPAQAAEEACQVM